MAGFALMLVGLAFALWVSFWVLLVLAGIGIACVVWMRVKAYLFAKGILNETPGVAPSEDEQSPKQITVIDGDYEEV